MFQMTVHIKKTNDNMTLSFVLPIEGFGELAQMIVGVVIW